MEDSKTNPSKMSGCVGIGRLMGTTDGELVVLGTDVVLLLDATVMLSVFTAESLLTSPDWP